MSSKDLPEFEIPNGDLFKIIPFGANIYDENDYVAIFQICIASSFDKDRE